MRNVIAPIFSFSAYSAWVDIRELFRRTRLGTIWHSLGHYTTIAALGIFFGTILKSDLAGYHTYIPFLAAGVIVWIFISKSVNDSCSLFGTQGQSLRHTAVPFVALPLQAVMKNLFVFVQNIVLGLVVYWAVFGEIPTNFLPFLLGVCIVVGNVFWLSLLMAVGSMRFRDLPQIVSGVLHVGFFLTPIIWQEHFLGRYGYLVDINPAYHLVSLVREPLLGSPPSAVSWLVGIGLLLAGGAITALVYARTRHQIPYWL